MNDHRLIKTQSPCYQHLKSHAARDDRDIEKIDRDVFIDCGWGKIFMGHTFEDPKVLADNLVQEGPGQRDVGIYVTDPHVVLSYAPQKLFLDPSDTMRLHLSTYRNAGNSKRNIVVQRAHSLEDARDINDIYSKCGMVTSDPDFIVNHSSSKKLIYLVAKDVKTGAAIGTAMGVNHVKLFDDPTRGSSLWCLATDPQISLPGCGEALVRYLAEYFATRNCSYMDLSVMHDNAQAKALYEKLNFQPIHTFTIKNKNAHNENLFLGPDIRTSLNPYASIIVDEARSRGIHVDVIDAPNGYFSLSRGGKTITCRESLSDLTSAIAMSRCQDKLVTHNCMQKAGIETPDHIIVDSAAQNNAFLEQHKAIVVKPCNGEQGKGITVGVQTKKELQSAIEFAKRHDNNVMLESYHQGEDLRIVVIGFDVVAAAIRKPATIIGDGQSTVRQLIEKFSRKRMNATGGESMIPLDKITRSCIEEAGYDYESVLALGRELQVRKTANLHTGGTIHDVTSELHPKLAEAAIKAARALDIPVVGLDFIVPAVDSEDYVMIEANERVGLANHEPQPTAQKFVDLLFPLSKSAKYPQ